MRVHRAIGNFFIKCYNASSSSQLENAYHTIIKAVVTYPSLTFYVYKALNHSDYETNIITRTDTYIMLYFSDSYTEILSIDQLNIYIF